MQPAPMGYNPGMPPAVHGNMLPFPPSGYPGYPGMYPFPPYYLPNTLPLPPAALPTPSVEIITLPRSVSLNEFCQFYKISDSDQEKLSLLEVELGDRRCEELGEEDWKNDAKFSKLGWERFKEKHARFCEDVKKGVWN